MNYMSNYNVINENNITGTRADHRHDGRGQSFFTAPANAFPDRHETHGGERFGHCVQRRETEVCFSFNMSEKSDSTLTLEKYYFFNFCTHFTLKGVTFKSSDYEIERAIETI